MSWESRVEELELVRRVPLFSMLSERHLKLLADAMVRTPFRRSSPVLRRGESGQALYILLSGRARVMLTDAQGREVTLAVLQPGDYVGEMSLIDSQRHSADVRCDTACEFLVLDGSMLAHCLSSNAELAVKLLRGLTARLRGALRQIQSLAFLDVYGRVAQALLDQAHERDGQLVVPPKLTRRMLASLCGASREMVTRVMLDLEGSGAVQVRADGSMLLRRARLPGGLP